MHMMLKCPACGTKVLASVDKCPECHALIKPYAKEETSPSNVPPLPKKKISPLAVVA